MDYRKALQIMGFTEHPTDEQLKKTYRKLSTKYHPDIAGDEHEEKFKEVAKAYKFLKDFDPSQHSEQAMDIPSTFFGKHVFTHNSIFTVFRQPL